MHAGGLPATLHHIRARYLILRGRRAAKSVLAKCMRCAKFRAKPAQEQVPPLPAFRIERSPPFAFTGVDFAGPLYTRNDNNERVKCYITLFTCAVTRAVHLELVPGLSTLEFLFALRRFINRRPTVRKIFSDNARSFKRAALDLSLIFDHVKTEQVQSMLANSRIDWEFITDRAPQHGAWWERMVQTVKRPLRKVLGTNCIPYRELETLLTDVEAMVNQRPLTPVASDGSEIRALCPADLLYGYSLSATLPKTDLNAVRNVDNNAAICSHRWKLQQKTLDAFWNRFRKDYLEYLRSAHTRQPAESKPLKPGDVCLLFDHQPSRSFWPLVRIVSTIGGERSDRRQRSCLIKLPSGQILKRPIHLLYPLETQ